MGVVGKERAGGGEGALCELEDHINESENYMILHGWLDQFIYYESKTTLHPAVRWKISSKLILASCALYSDRVYYWVCAGPH